MSLGSFVCDFVFLQHGHQNLCFLKLKGLIVNQKQGIKDIEVSKDHEEFQDKKEIKEVQEWLE